MQNKLLFTSESVGRGHPDKICDQISDAILDAYLSKDKFSRVAIETLASGNLVVVAGETYSKAAIHEKEVAISVLKSVGQYNENMKVISDVKDQSPDISKGIVLDIKKLGAGDQGIMFGYATNETKNYMPLPIVLAHEIVKLAELKRVQKQFKNAKSDMKSQVTVDYSDPKNLKVDTVLFSCQHSEDYYEEKFKEYIKKSIIKPALAKYGLDIPEKILINPTGRFVIGGPVGDTGLTGRKIIVDTYGGMARHGGGAFSGKDATKVDRSAAYACRWVAKNLVAAGVADKIEIQISYAIGVSEPVSIWVSSFGTAKVKDEQIIECINKLFDLTPYGIITELDLRRPIYFKTSFFGHFGRDDLDLPWEKLNKVEEIKGFFKNNYKIDL